MRLNHFKIADSENSMMLGIDIGGTKIELAVFDNETNLFSSKRIATPFDNYTKFLNVIEKLVNEADQEFGNKNSIGIGLPFVLDKNGYALSSNLDCVIGRPIKKDIIEKLKREVVFENDAKSFIFSEANGGVAQGFRRAVGVILGTGIGGAICLDGEIYQGKQDIAGEFGHTSIAATIQQKFQLPLRKCGCGKSGCVDQYISGPSLKWLSDFKGGNFDSVIELSKAISLGNQKATEVFDIYIECVSSFFAQITMYLDPDVIVLGGGISNIKEIYPEVQKNIQKYLFNNIVAPKIVPPKFGDSSGVRGVALLGRQRVNKSI